MNMPDNRQKDESAQAFAADQAFSVWRAFLLAEKGDPSLASNPYWNVMRADAAFSFLELFEACNNG